MNPAGVRALSPDALPQDAEAERSVLSAMLISGDVLTECMATVRDDDFHQPANRETFSAMRGLFDKGMSVDPISLADALRADGKLEMVGGLERLLDLANAPLSLASWENHAAILRKDAVLRRMIRAAAEISAMAYGSPSDIRDVVDGAERLMLSVTDDGVASGYSTMGEMMDQLYDELYRQAESGEDGGVSTGFPGIDRRLLGLRAGQMVVVGARPGVGKTSFCLNLAVNAASSGATVALFSLEMSKLEIAQRLLSARSGVPLTDIRSARMRQDQWQAVADAIPGLRELQILVDDTPGTTVTEIRAKARRMLHGRGDGLAIVDYLQLLSSPQSSDSRATQVGEMSRGLKIMAKDLGIPVVALSQLNRVVEGRAGKRPQLSDLRESGSIEQDADVVILLDRSMTPEEAEQRDRPDEGVTSFIIAKNRSGPLGTVSMRFDGSTIRFTEIDTFHAY